MAKDLSASVMRSTPLVTVLMPVFNGGAYLGDAIESILNQSFRDFEFIIINDGSTDHTSSILHRYERRDGRICIYHQENRGLIASLNRGCSLARGKYVARMDADDISLPERLRKQVQQMEARPEIGVLGTWVEYIDNKSAPQESWRMPTSPGFIGWSLLFGNCLAHPSVMMRREVLERLGFYKAEALHAEDYDLWIRASVVTRIANIPEVLLQRRVWEESVCSRYSDAQEELVRRVMRSKISELVGTEVPGEEIISLRDMATGSSPTNLQQIERAVSLIRELYRAYLKMQSLNRLEAKQVGRDARRKLCVLSVSACKISFWKGFAIFVKALALCFPWLSDGLLEEP